MSRRVVVTGLGMVTPLGVGVPANWEAVRAGRSGIGPITRFASEGFPCRIAGEVRGFRAEDWVDRRERDRMDLFILYAIAAAAEAVRDARLEVSEEIADRVGVVLGVGIGGLPGIEQNHSALAAGGPRKVSPYFIPAVIGNLAAGQIAIRLGARGVNLTTTTACASGAHAIGEAFEMIRSGRQDVVVTGGAEAAITPTAVAGFGVMRALARWDGPPEGASRPFDARRSGFVLGEGAGVLGYGASADAHHITQPPPDGSGAQRAIRAALAAAGVGPDAVQHVNAHGTSTRQGDIAETRALHAVFGAHARSLAVSATKSMTGHLLGAAGAVEAIYTVLALREQTVPPTINLDEPDPECDLDYVAQGARRARVEVALSNSFGFGGTNAALVFGAAA